MTLTLKFDLILKNLNLGCYLVMVATRRASLSSDISYKINIHLITQHLQGMGSLGGRKPVNHTSNNVFHLTTEARGEKHRCCGADWLLSLRPTRRPRLWHVHVLTLLSDNREFSNIVQVNLDALTRYCSCGRWYRQNCPRLFYEYFIEV